MSTSSTARLRILIAGEWQAEIHEPAWQRGLEELGHTVDRFTWFDRFARRDRGLSRFSARLQNKLLLGPRIEKLNADLIAQAREQRPDAIVLYRPTHVLAKTVDALKQILPRSAIATFNNDDAFSQRASPLLWRHYLQTIRLADLNLAYRSENLADLQAAGACGVHLLRSYYLPWRDRPTALSDEERERLGAEVLFAGHYEDDGRLAHLEAMAKSGLGFKIFGPDWDRAPRAPFLERFSPIAKLIGLDYVKAIAGARVAICLFSGLNRDRYTRRVFEITAIGTALLCQRTDEMQALFTEGVEAEYFSSPQEMVEKARRLLGDPAATQKMADAGRARAAESGYDVISRMRELQQLLQDVLAAKRGAA